MRIDARPQAICLLYPLPKKILLDLVIVPSCEQSDGDRQVGVNIAPSHEMALRCENLNQRARFDTMDVTDEFPAMDPRISLFHFGKILFVIVNLFHLPFQYSPCVGQWEYGFWLVGITFTFCLTESGAFVKLYLTKVSKSKGKLNMKTALIIIAIGLSLMVFILPLFCLILSFLEGRHHSKRG